MSDLISRQAAIKAICEDGTMFERQGKYTMTMAERKQRDVDILDTLPPAQLAQDLPKGCTDTISRQAVIDALLLDPGSEEWQLEAIKNLPSAQPPKEISKRVLWSGWKGYRDTRYKCPNCEKPVRNDDAYCHRCGQRLLFPNISFTDYVPGQKQDVIVRWDDEG